MERDEIETYLDLLQCFGTQDLSSGLDLQPAAVRQMRHRKRVNNSHWLTLLDVVAPAKGVVLTPEILGICEVHFLRQQLIDQTQGELPLPAAPRVSA